MNIMRPVEQMRITLKPHTIARLEKILGKRFLCNYDFVINQALDQLQKRSKRKL